MSRWVALHCSEEADELQSRHPNAFLLLCQIARRAKWKDCSITKLKAGEAFIGDWKDAGLPSEKAYRYAKKVLLDAGLVAFRGASKGTVATLTSSVVFSIAKDTKGGQEGEPGADEGRTRGEPGATNHTDTQIQGHTETLPPKAPKGATTPSEIIPRGSRRLSKTDQKSTKVLANTPTMIKLGALFGHMSETLWTVSNALRLEKLNPSEREVAGICLYYEEEESNPDRITRHSLDTLLNNWAGELDRARMFVKRNPHLKSRLPSSDPLPQADESSSATTPLLES